MRFKLLLMTCSCLLFWLAAATATAMAGTDSWASTGPYGGGVGLVISPDFASDHTLFAASAYGVFRSTDAGEHWSAVNSGLGSNLLYFVAVSPDFASDHTLFAATSYNGLFISADSGDHWTPVNTGPMGIESMAISPDFASDHTIFAGTSAGVYKSTDGGYHWNALNGLPNYNSFSCLVISPAFASDHTLFTYTGDGGGVYKSIDAGDHWVAMNEGITWGISSMAISPDFAADNTIFAGTIPGGNGIFMSTDGGAHWNPANTGLTASMVYTIAISPDFASDHTLFAGTDGGFYRSTDAGGHWSEPAFANVGGSIAISPDFATDKTLFATGGAGVLKSIDAGDDWSAVNEGLTAMNIYSIAVSPDFTSDHTLLAGTSAGSVFMSTDSGAHWNAINAGLSPLYAKSVAFSPDFASDNTIFAGTSSGFVFMSTDRGSHWSELNIGLNETYGGMIVNSLAVSPGFAEDHTLFVGADGHYSGDIYKVTGEGGNWSAANTGFPAWLSVGPVVLSPDFTADQTLFGSSPYGLFKSTDAGGHWVSASASIPGGGTTSLTVSPGFASDQTLFAGTYANGIYKSTDAGVHWSAANNGLTSLSIEALSFSPDFASDNTVFAGTWGGGIFMSTDAGASWSTINTGLDTLNVTSLAVSPDFASDHSVFAGTWGGGIFSNELTRSYHYWTWYDSQNAGSIDWVLLANPFSSSQNLDFALSIAGHPMPLTCCNNGIVAPGQSIATQYSGVIGGPVIATSLTGRNAIVSQRILWGGTSLEEVLGAAASSFSDHYYWSWYDQRTPGMTNWIVVDNPSHTEAVHAVISFQNQADGQLVSAESDIAPDSSWTPTFPGKMGGPVELKAYLSGSSTSWPADRRVVIASQRVLWNFGASLNEIPGIPAGDLSADYLWTWYDAKSPGFSDWLLIANPSDNPVTYQVHIGNELMPANDSDNPGTIPAHGVVTPSFAGLMDGPVEVTASDNVIASQRSLAGPSFEEVPGYPRARLASDYHWTWYDMKSPGSADWLLVDNPGDSEVSYQIKIGGTLMPTTSDNPGVIAAHGKVTPLFRGMMKGPVEVVSTGGPIMVSQRTLWNGYFNEVLGTAPN